MRLFEFPLAGWCPEGLFRTHQYRGLPIIHAIIDAFEIECVSTFLKTALRYHPNDLGLLFLKDNEGQTACVRAFKKYGNDKTMAVIGTLIPFYDPKVTMLLHQHVAKHAPEIMKDFVSLYLAPPYLTDSQGKTFIQAVRETGIFFVEDDGWERLILEATSCIYSWMLPR